MAVNEKEIEAIVKSVLDGMRDPSALASSTSTASSASGEIPKTAHVAMLTELKHFDINNIKMMDYFTSLTCMLHDEFPEYQVTFTTTFTNAYVRIIYDLVIHLAVSLMEEKYYDCCINQNNKISFRQLLSAILRLKPKNGEYTQSQITFLHYSLLDNQILFKGLSNMKPVSIDY